MSASPAPVLSLAQLLFNRFVGKRSTYARRGWDKREKKWVYWPARASKDAPLLALTVEAVERHLARQAEGDAIGIYPLLDDNRVHFAVFDVDNKGEPLPWPEFTAKVRPLVDRVREDGQPLLVRSGGGNGLHIALFFAQPQNAFRVRGFMTQVLMDCGLQERAQGGIRAGCVEIFPKQAGADRFGNLIALPFTRKSVPLDDNLQPLLIETAVDRLAAVPDYELPETRGDGRRQLVAPDDAEGEESPSADNVVDFAEAKRSRLDPASEAGVAEGGRDDTCWKWASKWRGEGIPIEEAEPMMDRFCDGCTPPLDRVVGREKLHRAYNQYEPNSEVVKGARKEPISQLDQLVKLARLAEIWRTDQTTYYATVRIRDRVEHMPINGQDFRRWLTREYINATKGRSPGSQAVADAAKVVEAVSTEAPIFQTARRVGAHGGKLYIDLCDLHRRAIEIDEAGWQIVPQTPVRFIRSAGMLPLPLPIGGGSIAELRPFINAGDASFRLLVATMLAYLRPNGPFPILAVHGEHGTAKSTTSRFVMNLIDPHQAELRRPPREDRDLVTAANHSWLLAFDNLSAVPQWMSDSFCVLSTSGSYAARAMRTDYDEVILSNLCRPLLLNGINDIDQYPDLTSRTIRVVLDPIPESERKTEAAIREAFEAARPRLLGALYTAVSCAMRRLPSTKLDRLPRLADFAMWATAAEEGLGWAPGTLMAAFGENQETSILDGLSGDTVAQALVGFVVEQNTQPDSNKPCWEGTATELHSALESFVSDEMRRTNFWPKTPRHLSGRLRKLAPGLRVGGVNLDLSRKDTSRNVSLITISRIGEIGIVGNSRGGSPNEGNEPSPF